MKSKFIILVVLAIAASSCCSVNAIKKLDLTCTYSEAYCGGAAPSEEMMQELKTPKPYTGKLYLYSNSEFHDDPVILDVVKGKIRLKCFAKGEYYVTRKKAQTPEDLEGTEGDPECYLQWLRIESKAISISSKDEEIKVHLNYTCDPCALPAP